MKRLTKLLALPLLLLLLLSSTVSAQNYRVAAGWRSGSETNGLTVKIVPINGLAFEGIYGLYPFGQSATFLVESSSCVFGLSALQMYAGAGGHYRFHYQDGTYSDPFRGTYDVYAPPGTRGWGIDGILGLELKLPVIPLAFNAEIKPMLEWTDFGATFTALDPALGIKLAF